MKKFFLLTIATLIAVSSVAQTKGQVLSHYILDDFTQGFIYMKSGVINSGMLNYNSVTEEMLFKERGKMKAIGKEEIGLVDTIVIQKRKFYPYNGKFVEVAYEKDGKELLVEHRCRVIEPPKPSAYGTTTETGASKSYTSLMANGIFYDLTVPEGYRIVPFKYYWFKDGDKVTKIINMRQMEKIFKGNKESYKEYMKGKNLSFNNVAEMSALVEHMLK